MSWEDGFEAAREAATRGQAAANPATIGEIASTQWEAAGLSTVFGVGAPWKEARDELARAVEGAAGMPLPQLAERQGRKLAAIGWAGASLEQEADELGSLAGGLTAEQQEKVKPHLDVAARARAIAAQRERQAADASERTYGLSGHAVGFLSGMARQAVDPVNLATMFVGGPLRGAVLPMLAREAGLGMAVQALQEPLIQPARAELGLEAGFGEAVTNILTAGVGNAGFAGLLRAGGWALRQARLSPEARAAELLHDSPQASEPGRLDAAAPEPAGVATPIVAAEPSLLGELSPADFAAASRLVEREQLIDAISPDRSPAGRILNADAVQLAMAELENGKAGALGRIEAQIDAAARRLDPALYAQVDGLANRSASLRAELGRLQAERADAASAVVLQPRIEALEAELAAITGKRRTSPRAQRLRGEIAELRAAQERHVEEAGLLAAEREQALRLGLSEADMERARLGPDVRRTRDAAEAETGLALPPAEVRTERVIETREADTGASVAREAAGAARTVEAGGSSPAASGAESARRQPPPPPRLRDARFVGLNPDGHALFQGAAGRRAYVTEDGFPVYEGPLYKEGVDADGVELRQAMFRLATPAVPTATPPARARLAGGEPIILPDVRPMLDRSEDAGRARARFADVLRAAEAAGGDLIVELDGGPVSLKQHLAEIKADADAAAALKDCLGQKGGDA